MKKKGFTLIELLVVIAIIALLLSILMPSLQKAKSLASRIVCSSNEKQIGLSLRMYAQDNNEIFPLHHSHAWMWDISYKTTDYIIETGGSRDTFYCPTGQGDPEIAYYWQTANVWALGTPYRVAWDAPSTAPEPESGRENLYRISDYFWLMDTVTGIGTPPYSSTGGKKVWPRKTAINNSSGTELLSDGIVSDGSDPVTANFEDVRNGGKFVITGSGDRSPHLSKGKSGKPKGGNVLYVDGHVDWRKFDEMEVRWSSDVSFWW